MEEWTRWEPVAGIHERFFIENFQMSYNGIHIKLCSENENKKIEILFFNGADAYRCTNESWCFDIFAVLKKKHGANFYADWSFFKIENSNYVQSLSATSAGVSEHTSFYHFCIVGNDEVIDVLATYQPQVRILA